MEQKKLLWIIFSLIMFLLVVVGVGIIWLYPGPQQPLVTEATTPTREAGAEFDPIEWVRSEQEAPGLEETKPEEEGEESFIVVYGETPEPEEKSLPKGEEKDAVSVKAEEPKDTGVTPAAESTSTARTVEKAPVKQAVPAPVTRTINVKEYWIQAGAYTSRSRADRIKEELDELGLSGRILSKDVEGTQYYRVRIGPYAEKAEADKFLTWVKQQEDFENSYISEVYRKKTVVQ